MKKILLIALTFCSIATFAQSHGTCGFDEHNEALKQQYPGSDESIHEQIIRNRNGRLNWLRCFFGYCGTIP